uniref:Putative secreted peptide n=1 Tax=Anopheles braziliensis TaxID=58242 RepID=A0A2M3ZT73_9DIPT
MFKYISFVGIALFRYSVHCTSTRSCRSFIHAISVSVSFYTVCHHYSQCTRHMMLHVKLMPFSVDHSNCDFIV